MTQNAKHVGPIVSMSGDEESYIPPPYAYLALSVIFLTTDVLERHACRYGVRVVT